MKVFNNGRGGIICDRCRTMIDGEPIKVKGKRRVLDICSEECKEKLTPRKRK